MKNCSANNLRKMLMLGILAASPLLLTGQPDIPVEVFKKHTAPVKALAFSSDGSLLATGGDDKMVYLWDLKTGSVIADVENGFAIKALEFTSDGNLLAACGKDVKLMDRQGKLISTFSGYTTDVWSFSYNSAARKLVAGSYAKYLRVWDLISADFLFLLEGHERSSLAVCMSPDGKTVASGSLDKSVRLWNAETGEQRCIMELHSGNIFAIDFHPSGKYLVSASADKTLRLWNADSGKIVRTFTGHPAAVYDVRFSSDGHHLLSCDVQQNIILWETATGKKLQVFTGHTATVNAVRFCPDGLGFASVSDDKTVRYWKLDKKIMLAGSFYDKEIESKVSQSTLFAPRGDNESKQDYDTRKAEADKFLDELYNQYYKEYLQMLSGLPVEGE